MLSTNARTPTSIVTIPARRGSEAMGKAAGSLPNRRDEDESSLSILLEYDEKET